MRCRIGVSVREVDRNRLFSAFPQGDLKSKYKGKNHIGNSIGNHQDNRLDADYIRNRLDEDNIR